MVMLSMREICRNPRVPLPGIYLVGVIYSTLVQKAAVLAYNLSQGHPFADANKRTVSGALEKFIKENRNGRGLIGHCADEYPITLDEFTVALGKIMPSRRINEKL